MGTGDDQLEATAVLSVALAALHQIQEEEDGCRRTARSVSHWDAVLFDEDSEDEEEVVGPKVKRTRRVTERRDWRTSAWWEQLQDVDLADHTTAAASVSRTLSCTLPLLSRTGQAVKGEAVVFAGGEGCS
ncbi:unnamed protein product [Ectocarpus sp. CCAP 1310/34]|nr:unnamed protein product [Ectocarpus sp. CCAP 1310/34]